MNGVCVLLQPTVLGELLDQIMLLEGFYAMGPIVGILTTGVEWMVCWLPSNENAFEKLKEENITEDFKTPLKGTIERFQNAIRFNINI